MPNGEHSVENIPASYSTDDEAAASILHATIQELLGPYDANIVWLKAVEDYQLKEIAQILGISQKAVYHRYSKSMKRLRGVFSPPP